MNELQFGEEFTFAAWPDGKVPPAAGVYTIWRTGAFIYVGMSGNLRRRLNSHASGRRSGDQFNIYVFDRFVVPGLTAEQQEAVERGDLLLDGLTREYIRTRLTYRFVVQQGIVEARLLERAVQAGLLPAGRPYLNPLLIEQFSRRAVYPAMCASSVVHA